MSHYALYMERVSWSKCMDLNKLTVSQVDGLQHSRKRSSLVNIRCQGKEHNRRQKSQTIINTTCTSANNLG